MESPSELSGLDTDKMRKLIGMMSSDNANERANAASLFSAYLKSKGVQHEELAFKRIRPIATDLAALRGEVRRTSLESQELLRRHALQETLRRDNQDRIAILKFEIEMLRSFVSKRVHHIVADQVEKEGWRLSVLRSTNQPADYQKGAAGEPTWKNARDKKRDER